VRALVKGGAGFIGSHLTEWWPQYDLDESLARITASLRSA
jgi:dTDP-D-glucose 4,6-dehydratase